MLQSYAISDWIYLGICSQLSNRITTVCPVTPRGGFLLWPYLPSALPIKLPDRLVRMGFEPISLGLPHTLGPWTRRIIAILYLPLDFGVWSFLLITNTLLLNWRAVRHSWGYVADLLEIAVPLIVRRIRRMAVMVYFYSVSTIKNTGWWCLRDLNPYHEIENLVSSPFRLKHQISC